MRGPLRCSALHVGRTTMLTMYSCNMPRLVGIVRVSTVLLCAVLLCVVHKPLWLGQILTTPQTHM